MWGKYAGTPAKGNDPANNPVDEPPGSGRRLSSGQRPPENACHGRRCLFTLHLGKPAALPIPIARSAV